MPGQDIEIQGAQVLKVLNMAPTIPSNNSHEQLMRASESPMEDRTPSLKDVTSREWVAILILCFVNLINYMDRYTLAGILVDVQKHFDIDDGQAGLLQTSFVLSYMVFAPIFGYLGDRYSRKYIMTAGVFLWSLTTLLGSFMNNFGWFIMFRAFVGIGEASYSTIAPTIISDLFIKDVRSKMLTLFYFAIPVGSGLGYIIGSETAALLGSWHWALRVTPALGLVAVILILFILQDPERGASEGSGHLKAGALKEDLRELSKNGSFILSTAGFTCVAFVAGALAWWGPKLIALGISLQGDGNGDTNDVSFKFGAIAMASGVIGVPLGSFIAQRYRQTYERIDPHICAAGLLMSAPMIFVALLMAPVHSAWCYFFVFLGEVFLNLTWSIVADILLYVVLPTRRSTAEGVQLLVSHALGDAGSPYLVGLVSESLKISLGSAAGVAVSATTLSGGLLESGGQALLTTAAPTMSERTVTFHALQYALFITCFVEVLGGFFFLLNAFYIVKDKDKVEKAVKGFEPTNLTATETERSQLMS